VIDAIFVPRGAEADAVRAGLGPEPSPVRIFTTGMGPRAALRAANEAIAAGPPIRRALVTGLCGLLSDSLAVGDALAYGEVRHPHAHPILLERLLIDLVAERVPGMQSGIRAVHSDTIVCSAAAKADLAARFDAEAVDMESFALVERLHRSGIAVAIVRVGSDAARHDLPDLERARDGAGGLDTSAVLLAMVRRPLAGARLAANGVRALGALRRTVSALVARG
jgi:nucleoside phosphorylase